MFVVGYVIAGYFSLDMLRANAREEVLEHARLMMEASLAARTYTNTQVKPLLEAQPGTTFLPQSVPAYAAGDRRAARQGAREVARRPFPERAGIPPGAAAGRGCRGAGRQVDRGHDGGRPGAFARAATDTSGMGRHRADDGGETARTFRRAAGTGARAQGGRANR